ncbi:hypothetical protein L7F22_020992 [Adiantum nelumboides]|nr:hypothetical protein [Adiantum nelumboides]
MLAEARASKVTKLIIPMMMEQATLVRIEKAKALQEEKQRIEAQQKAQEVNLTSQSTQEPKEKEVVDLTWHTEHLKKIQRDKSLEEQRAAALAREKIKEGLKRETEQAVLEPQEGEPKKQHQEEDKDNLENIQADPTPPSPSSVPPALRRSPKSPVPPIISPSAPKSPQQHPSIEETFAPSLSQVPKNKDPRVVIEHIPLDFEQFLSRCRLERVEEISTFVTPRSYTLAIADAPYGFCAPNPFNDDVKYGVSAYKKIIETFGKVTTCDSCSLVFFHAHDQITAAQKAFTDSNMTCQMLTWIKPNIYGCKLDRLSWACEFATIGFYSSLGVQSKGSYNFTMKPNRTNVFEQPGVCKKFKHTDADLQGVINPYQKPQILMMDLIDLLSMRGEWIMDLFAGEGENLERSGLYHYTQAPLTRQNKTQ